MDQLLKCNDKIRQTLVDYIQLQDRKFPYAASVFSQIMIDIAHLLAEESTQKARNSSSANEAIVQQLKPFFVFNRLLGKCPQVASLMYSYFRSSSLQILPTNLFEVDQAQGGIASYAYEGFSDALVKDILVSYLKYLSYDTRWFSSIWNWGQLSSLLIAHPDLEIRYLAICCLSVITRPTRIQHLSFLRNICDDDEQIVNIQYKYRHIYENTFKPLVEPKATQMSEQFVASYGASDTDYSFCHDSIAKLANVLLLKRDASMEDSSMKSKYQQAIDKFVPIPALSDTISRIAYSISINRPCLIRGPTGSGKTSIIDYIAAHTNRLKPPEYVKVQICDQVDSKLLIGSYVATELPGQFEWRPGPLTKAMVDGAWILFEDIQSAPADMTQMIHSVIENGNLSCVGSCPIKLNHPHPEFRVLFTQQSGRSNSSRLSLKFIEKSCDIVEVPDLSLSEDDLNSILSKKYKFEELSSTIVHLFLKTKQLLSETIATPLNIRYLTLRTLFKLCDRLASRNLKLVDGKLTNSQIDSLLCDTVDCFLSFLPTKEALPVVVKLGQILNISSEQVGRLIIQRNPDMREAGDIIQIGRIELKRFRSSSAQSIKSRSPMAYTKRSLQLLENIAHCIKQSEPVLLVGETGVGKTSMVQHLAELMHIKLVVINLSQQSDSSDLLGGFKPVEIREIMIPVHYKFEEMFRKTYDATSNQQFLHHVNSLFVSAKKLSEWSTYLKLVGKLCSKSLSRELDQIDLQAWSELKLRTGRLISRLGSQGESSPMALAFSDGSLMRAVKEGKWILLDEINLAEPDVLQCLLLILDSMKMRKIHLTGPSIGVERIDVHPNFRLYACMNPSTDVGKKDLDPATRDRFTEFFVDDIEDKNDLRLIVDSYVKSCLSPPRIDKVVDFYREVRARGPYLADISGNSPIYSLRTLCRTLSICSANVCGNITRSLYESLQITFLHQLNESSKTQVVNLMANTVFEKAELNSINSTIQMPKDDHGYIMVEGFWIQKSSEKLVNDTKYILTKTISKNLRSLARIISLSQRRLPILIQGNTSVGKTSLIMHLAKMTGNKCYRINNHEHTDIQEYLGRYVLRESGEISFQEGLLVTAMRKGYWVILDELNLAPTDLLEALNRVLDDNRELFIPETRETIKAHSKFVLFATQNPPQEYAGRKMLSRAFRNRFVEIHFDDLPSDELEMILQGRCEMPPKYAQRIVSVMRELQLYRRESGCFNGKNGFMNMRDLLRWGERYAQFKKSFPDNETCDWDAYLASEGLILLEGRVRTITEAEIVKNIIEKVFKLELDRQKIYEKETFITSDLPKFKHVHFSREFQRMFVQLTRALRYKEPVLLCGQTGCGKTTSCQIYSEMFKQKLITYNCHQGTESSDFVGGVRPTRNEEENKQTFPWQDGQLLRAMKKGAIFLMDEISLADDAVLERINSVLEPTRSITLSEKDGEEIYANEAFRLVATMNPGGDYGKKELSQALRNRFTEIYCHNTVDLIQIRSIIEKALFPALMEPKLAPKILTTMDLFLKEYYKNRDTIYLRDILSWCKFLNMTTQPSESRPLSIQEALVNGAALVFFDQVGTCGHKASLNSTSSKLDLKARLLKLVLNSLGKEPVLLELRSHVSKTGDEGSFVCRFKKFHIPRGPNPISAQIKKEFVVKCASSERNIMKLARAMQLDRPILLEGDPGVGKTSLIATMAKLTGHNLVRINLSEQTDISDLFGQDLPDINHPDEDNPHFCWYDGPMLRAIRNSDWILLDEMNLASQSVLEGLNACFDHRGEIFIPELGKRIIVDRSKSRIFACQNPYMQGAARKGLPQSFLNRFTSIYIEPHSLEDLKNIVIELYPNIKRVLVKQMIDFNDRMNIDFKNRGFEFNLRDVLYWCDLTMKYIQSESSKMFCSPVRSAQFVYLDRMRTPKDRLNVKETFEKIFGYPIYEPPYREIKLGEETVVISRSILPRNFRPAPHLHDMCILKYQLPYIESVAKAIEHNKMPILVGESQVGKRSIVKILAGLTGNKLNILGANQEMDTIELLGSYEQKSLEREVVDLVEEARQFTIDVANSVSNKEVAHNWTNIYSHIWSTLYQSDIEDTDLKGDRLIESYSLQLTQLKDLITAMQPFLIDKVKYTKRAKSLSDLIDKMLKKIALSSSSKSSLGIFEWIDSILIESVKKGSWLMIQNANLMNPATLDRLNSLVEPNGSISLNEKGSGPDGIEKLVPHPNFRLILTVNPEHGELSRAMKNRGVEIFIQTRFFFEDFLMILNQNGYEPQEDKACMLYCIMKTCCKFHEWITGDDPAENGSVLTNFALNFTSALTNQVRRGADLDQVLADYLIEHYSNNGYANQCKSKNVQDYICSSMDNLRLKHLVKLVDDQYKWMLFRHDLPAMIGGDALPLMVVRDHRIFFAEIDIDSVLKHDERIDDLDIVNSCISIKIFLEQSSPADLDQRRGFIQETFDDHPELLCLIERHFKELKGELLPVLQSLMPKSSLISMDEVCIDSRNSPELDYLLRSLDYESYKMKSELQNRWIVSMYRLMLTIIIGLVERRSMNIAGNTSLWNMSERLRKEELDREDLIRPVAEIAVDLFDLLVGLLREVNNRCLDNRMVAKILPRLFWLNCFVCKLRKGYSENELIAICNQIPMLWSLTYQKVIQPLITDCKLSDSTYKNKKFSRRIQEICDFLKVSISKPVRDEKMFFKKIVNTYASTVKLCDSISRETDRFYTLLAARCSQRLDDINLSLAYSSLIWTKSDYLAIILDVQDSVLKMEDAIHNSDLNENLNSDLLKIQKQLADGRAKFDFHDEKLKISDCYRESCASLIRGKSALDQSAPIWQLRFLRNFLAKLHPSSDQPANQLKVLTDVTRNVNGIVMSPKFYACLIKFLNRLIVRNQNSSSLDFDASSSEAMKLAKENADMYSALLIDLLQENMVLDQQVVTWTKTRIATCSTSTSAPLLPEYSPIISLVASYSLDIAHLKLNSYTSSRAQIESLLIYLCKNYVPIKLDMQNVWKDFRLAKNLIHLRANLKLKNELIGSYECSGPEASDCQCVEHYIERRVSSFKGLVTNVASKFSPAHQLDAITTSLKLIYFGHLFCLEHAPILTIDPSLRVREKLEVYKAELAHIKLDLHLTNTLYYWRTGENLQLEEFDPEEPVPIGYPFSIQVMVERRIKLEQSIAKLSRESHNRPKSDDGLSYSLLRKEVGVMVDRCSANIQALINEFTVYLRAKKPVFAKLINLTSRCQMMAKSLEKSISHLRYEYSLYSDLTTNFLSGASIALQGLRCLYFNLEQAVKLSQFGYTNAFQDKLSSLFSLNNLTGTNFEMVDKKLSLFSQLDKLCLAEDLNALQSKVLKSILDLMHTQIMISPSDIPRCLKIVQHVADLYHSAWLERKRSIEEQRKAKEDLYQYKTSRTVLGLEISLEREEFIEICTRFPTYEHLYKNFCGVGSTSADEENLETEEKVINLNKTADLANCIDICKSYYKLMIEASRNLLGQQEMGIERSKLFPNTNMKSTLKIEAEILYSISRHSLQVLDQRFDSLTIDYHLMQNKDVVEIMQPNKNEILQLGSLNNSIEILDEEVFNIYHDGNPQEALKLQGFVQSLNSTVQGLRAKGYDAHPTLLQLVKLMTKISSFLITDPTMKFITGSHTLLERMEAWNRESIPKEEKLLVEATELIEIIKSWRKIEVESWQSSLHWVKRTYIDNTLCDLWFRLYDAFKDPIAASTQILRERFGDPSFSLSPENEELVYMGFTMLIKTFLEDSTHGDYQLRLDLVHSFAIQTLLSRADQAPNSVKQGDINLDLERLTIYVYNTHKQYSSLFKPVDQILEKLELNFSHELKDQIRIVAWQGRNLWEIKNNFRISHRKLNSVMSKYLKVLRQPMPNLSPQENQVNLPVDSVAKQLNFESDRLGMTLNSIHVLVESVRIPNIPETPHEYLNSIRNNPKTIQKFKDLTIKSIQAISSKYVDNIATIEQVSQQINDLSRNFYGHKVSDVVIHSKDSKEVKSEKEKLCRQMYHSKKFSVQSLFKSLRELGLSYQRGLSKQELLDSEILSLEPVRGMIKSQNKFTLDATSKLIDNTIITNCHEKYWKLISNNLALMAQPRSDDLTSDQMNRIRGLALDLTLKIIDHNRSSAKIYRHLISIQAATKRLDQLKNLASAGEELIVHNFSRTQSLYEKMNQFVQRVYLAVIKINELVDCCELAADIEHSLLPSSELQEGKSLFSDSDQAERRALHAIMGECSDSNSLISHDQLEELKPKIIGIYSAITRVNSKLADKLNNNKRNYLYGQDDIHLLEELAETLRGVFNEILGEDQKCSNMQPNTPLGSIKLLLSELQETIQPQIDELSRRASSEHNSDGFILLCEHPKLDRLDLRLNKLIRQAKLVMQDLSDLDPEPGAQGPDHRECKLSNDKSHLKFDFIDAKAMAQMLRLEKVDKHLGDVIFTLNSEDCTVDVAHLVENIAPLTLIYTQKVAAYLNTIFVALSLKLDAANQVIVFFTDLVTSGFGLPYKVDDRVGEANAQKEGKLTEDNTGFGEGEGKTDVSKKLEFESQLDGLKGQEDKASGEEDNIEAHDDGVEMSDDIGGKAVGPEQGQDEEQTENADKNESDCDSQDDETAELEKEMDTVDDDEGQLNQNLWSDDEQDFGEDDEQDLRDAAENESKVGAKTELEAKDDKLTTNEAGKEAKQEENQLAPADEQDPQDDSEAMKDDKSTKPPKPDGDNEVEIGDEGVSDEDEGENEQLDMEQESALAKANQDANQAENIDEAEMDNITLEDMSPEPDEIDDEAKREGECPADDEGSKDDETGEAEETGDISFESEEVDKMLEQPVEPHPNPSDLLDPIEKSLRAAAQASGKNSNDISGPQENPGDITHWEEKPNDHLDPDDDTEFEDKNTRPAYSATGFEDSSRGKAEKSTGGRENPEQQQQQQEKAAPKDPDEPRSGSTKRTQAEISGGDQMPPKRQRIEEASSEQSDAKKDTSERESTVEGGSVRHLQADNPDSHVVIDVVSDSDDENFVDANSESLQDDKLKMTASNPTEQPQKAYPEEQDIELNSQKTGFQESTLDQRDSSPPQSGDMMIDEEKSLSSVSSLEIDPFLTESAPPRAERNLNSSYNTNLGLLKYISLSGNDDPKNQQESEDGGARSNQSELLQRFEENLAKINMSGDLDSIGAARLANLWLHCTRHCDHLVQELCQQLQIVLQPTNMSKYKGDYKSGKRLNMRKIIAYIASNYRKDKIWLRRTKPNKRNYNICLAVDNSTSMSENNCRLMTFQSLALLAKSLSLIEAGQLSVLSFGEKVRCIHEFGQRYMEEAGGHWLRELRFNESRTSYSQLLAQACKIFSEEARLNRASDSSVSQLLIVLSDGRNVLAEEEQVRAHLRQLKSMRVLTLFVIIDDLRRNDGKSIVDVKKPVGIGTNLVMLNYMELFPFPFYVLLRNLEAMPSILGDALRQWFELVSQN